MLDQLKQNLLKLLQFLQLSFPLRKCDIIELSNPPDNAINSDSHKLQDSSKI